MKAAVLEQYGDATQFRIREVADPMIREGQILVQNRASSVNPVDVELRKGKLRLATGLFGDHLIGTDFAGTVVATKSDRFQVGDPVFGFKLATDGHTYASLLAADAANAVLKPEAVTFTEAAALALTSVTAYQGLLQEGGLQAGQQVLLNGCTGGVGCAAIQIARAYGAIVTGTCSPRHAAIASQLGCDFVIDYHQPLPAGRSYDLIFDMAAKLTLSEVENCLIEKGLLVTIRPNTEDLKHTVSSGIDLLKRRMKLFMAKSNAADLTVIRQLIEAGKLKPVIAATFPLEQLGAAHQQLEAGGFAGKIAIEI